MTGVCVWGIETQTVLTQHGVLNPAGGLARQLRPDPKDVPARLVTGEVCENKPFFGGGGISGLVGVCAP